MFEALSRQLLSWDNVWVTLADERWVEPTAEASNERLVRRHLLRNQARQANFLPLKNRAASAQEGRAACEVEIARLPRPFDVVVLGMGPDGHFASLFPGGGGLQPTLGEDGSSLVTAVRPATAEHSRLSLTLAALLDSRRIYLHLTGEGKQAVLERAQRAGLAGQQKLPIAALLAHAGDRLEVYWAP